MKDVILPKYVEKALRNRTKYIQRARAAGAIVDNYAKKLGIDERHQDFQDACIYSDVRIYCEVICAENITRNVLLKVLSENLKKEDNQ